MPDRFAFYDPVPKLDLDEDGIPCQPEFPELWEPETDVPDDPVCPVLESWLAEARSAEQVSEMFRAHEKRCPLCHRRAA